MPLYLFYTMVQKSQKWPKTQIKGGSCLKFKVANTPKFNDFLQLPKKFWMSKYKNSFCSWRKCLASCKRVFPETVFNSHWCTKHLKYMGTTCGRAVVLNDLEEFGLFEADEKSVWRQMPRSQMSWKTLDLKSGLEPTAPIAVANRKIALYRLSQILNCKTDGSLVNFRRKPFQSTQKTTEDVDNSKDCRSFDVDLHCNTFKIRFCHFRTVYTQAYGGTGAIAPEHAAAIDLFFFFGPRKRGVRPHPPNPPWLRYISA